MDRGGHPHSPILSSCPCPAYDGGGHAAGELTRSFSFSPPNPPPFTHARIHTRRCGRTRRRRTGQNGGGIYSDGGQLTMTSTTLTGCTATNVREGDTVYTDDPTTVGLVIVVVRTVIGFVSPTAAAAVVVLLQ